MSKPKQSIGQLVPGFGNEKALLASALRFMQTGMSGQARQQCEQVLRTNPRSADAHYLMGLVAARSGNFEAAAERMAKSLQIAPDNPAALNNYGVALRKLQRNEEAIGSFSKAIALKRDYVEAHFNLGNALREEGRLDQALASYDAAIALKPDFAAAYNGRGNVLADLNRHTEALTTFDKAIALKPDFGEAYSNKANSLFASDQAQEALAHANRAIELNPDNVEAHLNRGNALAKLKRYEEGLAAYDRAIALRPDNAPAYSNRGALLVEVNRAEEALHDFDKSIELDPEQPTTYENRAQASAKARRYGEAIDFYRRLVELAADYPYVKGNLLHAQMLCSDWQGFETLCSSIQAGVRAGARTAEPFGYQGVSESEQDLLMCAEIFARDEYPAVRQDCAPGGSQEKQRITIGYLCGEFRQHATSILMCGVYEQHRKDRFRLIAFDNGGSDASDYRRRIDASFDEVVDITGLGDHDAANLISSREVDILVNLNGYFGAGRMGVFARRPSPIQVNYLGFPGTLGAPYMDYLIADEVVIPPTSRQFYSAKIVYLPHSYQANDSKRSISDKLHSRELFGLPPNAFVFCCFNNNYKITPGTFDSWMRILGRAEGSVLWLLQDNPDASANLTREAEARGIASNRLVFAQRLPPDEHLARHKVADLFLDTLPYNAHTTASDALWAGLPVLTRVGTTFPGRVGASLLKALDLPELVTDSASAYEDLAVELASDPAMLARIRERLQANRSTQPLFNTQAFARHLEAAYLTMMQRHRDGAPPDHIDLRA